MLVLWERIFVDWKVARLASGTVCRVGVAGVHASKMLGEEILAFEVVVVDGRVGRVVRCRAKVAAPEPNLNVLRANMTLPFVLGDEVCQASVDGKRTREGTGHGPSSAVFRRVDCFALASTTSLLIMTFRRRDAGGGVSARSGLARPFRRGGVACRLGESSFSFPPRAT